MKLTKRMHKNEFSWVIDYYDRGGKRQRYTLKDIKTQKNAEIAFAKFRLRYEQGELDLPTDEKISLSDVLAARIDDRKRAGCVNNWLQCLTNYKKIMLSHFGKDVLFRALNDKAVAEYRIARLDDEASAQTVNKELMFLHAAGKLAIVQRKIARLPWNKIDRAIERHTDEVWGYLKADEIVRLLQVLKRGTFQQVEKQNGRFYPMKVKPNPLLWRMVTFLINTGARRGEMFALKWGDVNMDIKTVRLVSSKSAKNGQSAKPRYIPMNDSLIELFRDVEQGEPNERVFKRDTNLRRKFKMALIWAGLPEYRVHDLRHTFASHLVINGIPLYTVSKLLGHSSIEVTQRYAHLAPDSLMKAVHTLSFNALNEIESSTQNTSVGKEQESTIQSTGHVSVTQSTGDNEKAL